MQAFLQRVERSKGPQSLPAPIQPRHMQRLGLSEDQIPTSPPGASLQAGEQDPFSPSLQDSGSTASVSPHYTVEPERRQASPDGTKGQTRLTDSEATKQAQLTIELQAVKACTLASTNLACSSLQTSKNASHKSHALPCAQLAVQLSHQQLAGCAPLCQG